MNDKDKETFRTDSLYLATALVTAGHPLLSLAGDFPHRAVFVYHKTRELEKTVEAFHSDSLTVSAKRLLYAQKELKDRLWEESRRL